MGIDEGRPCAVLRRGRALFLLFWRSAFEGTGVLGAGLRLFSFYDHMAFVPVIVPDLQLGFLACAASPLLASGPLAVEDVSEVGRSCL